MPELNGFQAHILITGGQKLPEYNIEVAADGKSVTCWVPSYEGKRFSVQWKDTRRMYTTDGAVKLDGVKCGGQLLHNKTKPGHPHPRKDTGPTAIMDSVHTTNTTTRPFIFSPLELTDDDTFLDSSRCLDIGNIELTINRVTIEPPDKSGNLSSSIPDNQKIHERAKKVGAHHIKFGDEVVVKAKNTVQVVLCDKEPIVKFYFKYRSIEILQANGIAPIPSRNSGKRKAIDVDDSEAVKVEDLDEEEAILKKKLKAIQRKRAKVTRAAAAPAFKTEPKRPFISGEVIDLT